MTGVVRKLQQVQIPPHQLAKLGLEKDWYKKVSPEFVDRAVKAAEKHKEVLRELAKY